MGETFVVWVARNGAHKATAERSLCNNSVLYVKEDDSTWWEEKRIGKEVFFTEREAVESSNRWRLKRIESLLKQLEKLKTPFEMSGE
jgi:CRISPR/Cas system-associated protein Cas7 (RAMP superfamily)